MLRQRRRTTFTAALLLAGGLAVSGGFAGGLPAGAAAPVGASASAEGIPFPLTETELVVRPNALIAFVDPVQQGGPAPTGQVTFSVDGQPVATADLVDGVARSRTTVFPGQPREIGAEYGGSERYTSSSDSYLRTDPTAELTVRGTQRNGWYRTPAVVTTACEPGSGTITRCTRQQVIQQSTAEKMVTGVARADDGGVGLDGTTVQVDLDNPILRITGGGQGPFPRDARPVGCRATDDLSGIDGRCRVTYGEVTRTENGPKRPWRASVRDVAGNTVVRRGAFRVTR